jgi:secondary thiamine-phosphate synthase enzyme
MRQTSGWLSVHTRGRGLVDITAEVRGWLDSHPSDGPFIITGLLTLFCTHTSASLLIQENAAAAVRSDIEAFFERLVPENPALYGHGDEGPDDMPAHLRAALTQVHLSVPIADSQLVLGTWQAIYLFEHRRRPHERRIAIHVIGE